MKIAKAAESKVTSQLMPTIDQLAKQMGIKVDVHGFKSTEASSEHDWTKDPAGGSYLARLRSRFGPAISERLEFFKRQELEPALERKIGRRSAGNRAPRSGRRRFI
jgi:hypothetical protein